MRLSCGDFKFFTYVARTWIAEFLQMAEGAHPSHFNEAASVPVGVLPGGLWRNGSLPSRYHTDWSSTSLGNILHL